MSGEENFNAEENSDFDRREKLATARRNVAEGNSRLIAGNFGRRTDVSIALGSGRVVIIFSSSFQLFFLCVFVRSRVSEKGEKEKFAVRSCVCVCACTCATVTDRDREREGVEKGKSSTKESVEELASSSGSRPGQEATAAAAVVVASSGASRS